MVKQEAKVPHKGIFKGYRHYGVYAKRAQALEKEGKGHPWELEINEKRNLKNKMHIHTHKPHLSQK